MKQRPSDFDYWCLTCGEGFYSGTMGISEHDSNGNNTGHSIYDGLHIDDRGNVRLRKKPLYTIDQTEQS